MNLINSITKTIIIIGTHLTPAIELINQLKADEKYHWQINYIGRKYNSTVDQTPSIESEIIPKLKVNFYSISGGKLDRRYLPNTLHGISHTIKGFFESFSLISKIKPDIIISFGGYISVPVIISGWFKKIPSITHEQTLTNSLTTKINSHFVNKIALSFNNPNQLPKNKIVITGNLLRSEIYKTSSVFFRNLSLEIGHFPLLYITAGNQGSHLINQIIKNNLSKFNKNTIIHQTGKNDYSDFQKINQPNYHAFDYINLNDIGWVLNNADIIISRAGANTCQEIVALQKKSILIPLPVSQQNEQHLNAIWVHQQLPQKTIIITQKKLSPKTLLNAIKKLSLIKTDTAKIKPSTNLKLLKLIHETL